MSPSPESPGAVHPRVTEPESNLQCEYPAPADATRHNFNEGSSSTPKSWFSRAKHAVVTFGKFVGPGFMVAVAYSMEDPPVSGDRRHLVRFCFGG